MSDPSKSFCLEDLWLSQASMTAAGELVVFRGENRTPTVLSILAIQENMVPATALDSWYLDNPHLDPCMCPLVVGTQRG